MKIKKIILGLILVILLICLIPINLQSTRILSILDSDLETSQTNYTIDYVFNDNVLDSDKTKINLRHNNIITNDYNGTYSFVNDSGVPIGWNNLSETNGRIVINERIDKHDSVLSLITTDYDNAQIEQDFSEASRWKGSIEFWFRTSDATQTSYVRILSESTSAIRIKNSGDIFQIYEDGSPTTLDTIAYDNIWYHFNIYFDCQLDISNISINSYYEGSFDFDNNVATVDTLDFLNLGTTSGWSIFFDAVGYSWSSNYTIGENIYPNIQKVDSNILTSDMYQFNFNSTGNPYIRYETNIHGWTNVQPTYSYIDKPSIHYHYYDLDIKNETIKEKNAIWIKSHTSGAGIKNDTLEIYKNKINITFGINFYLSISYLQHSFNISIKSSNNTEIIKLGFDPVFVSGYHTYDLLDMYYYDGAEWQFLERFHKVKNYELYQFNLYLDNFNVNLKWYKDGVYNNSYTFPFIIETNGVNSVSFLNHDAYQDAYFQFIRLCYVGIYQYNISLSNEYGCMRYNFKDIWNFNTYNLFSFISDDFTKLITYIYNDSYEGFNIRNHFDQSIFYNLYKKEIKSYTNLWIISNSININNELSIKGIKMVEYIESVFNKEYIPHYASFNVNENNSYFYVDNCQLKYNLHLTLNYTFENIIIYFGIDERTTDNATLVIAGHETLTCFGQTYFLIEYLGFQAPTRIDLVDYYSVYFKSLPFARAFNVFTFTANDFFSNNTFTGLTYHGFFSDLKIIYNYLYVPPYVGAIEILALISIIIPMIIILCPTFAIHALYKKKEAIIPMLIFFSIIAFATSLLPFQVFFIIMIALGCGLFLQYKNQKGV